MKWQFHSENTMTVAQLIQKLQLLVESDPKFADYPVETEGCDCYGDAEDISVETGLNPEKEHYVLITRI